MARKEGNIDDVKPATVEKFRLFLTDEYNKELYKAAEEEAPLLVDFERLDRRGAEGLAQMLLEEPDKFIHVAEESVNSIDLPAPVKIRFRNLPDTGIVNIRDLRSKHIGRFLSVEGTVRRASEIRPEIVAVDWKCLECDSVIRYPVKGTFVSKPFRCVNEVDGKQCNGKRFVEAEKVMIDTRWITIEEPFELTEGEKPSQVNVWLTEDLVSPEGRRMTDPGNRLKIMGVLREVPKGKTDSVKLDFYFDANHVEPTETSWEKLKISKEDEAEIKKLASDPNIYDKLVDSMAPSLFGLRDIKASIIMQLFGGVPRTLPDGTHFRGDIHILIIGDPASGKSQLLKLVPEIVPRGRYVSGKGVTGAGLTATVTKDEQFMGGWVLEAGALVLTNKGLLAIDEFEKMSPDDQVAMHEALEQGCYDYGTMVMMHDGTYGKIGDVVEKRIAGMSGERIARPVDKKSLQLMSTDFKDNFFDGVTVVGKHKEKELMRVRLSTGHELKITKAHPVFVFKSGKIELKNAKDLKKSDYLILPKSLEFKGKPQTLPRIPENKKFKPIKIPQKTSDDFCEFLGYFLGEGNRELSRGVGNGIGFTNSDANILRRYRYLVKHLFDPKSFEQKKGNRVTIRIISRPLSIFLGKMGNGICAMSWEKSIPSVVFRCPERETNALLAGLFNSDGTVNYDYGTVSLTTTSRELADQVQHLLLRAGIFSGVYTDRGLSKRKRPAFKVQISGKGNLRKYAEKIGFIDSRNKKHLSMLLKKETKSSRWDHVPGIMERVEIAKKTLRLSDKDISGYILTNTRERDSVSKKLLRKIIGSFENRKKMISKGAKDMQRAKTYGDYLRIRQSLGISRSEIARKMGIPQQNLWYHKVVKGEKRLLEKSISICTKILLGMIKTAEKEIQDLKRISLMPFEFVQVKSLRRIKNREEWVYDVTVNPTQTFMANGIACHNSISIAKASIVATLPAKTSVLAGGNPKFSRFDPMRSIHEQVNIAPTLLSRFDLKFTLRDVPNAKEDKKIVEHVLKSRHEKEKITPVISPDMIRKYVAYAKEKCHPELTPEVSKLLQNFYVKTRGRAEGGRSPVPITLRQFEALMRLSEASAKIRLSPIISKDDAQRAIKLMKASLKDLGSDVETGEIDVDKSEGGTPFSERSKITKILNIIDGLSGDKRDIVPIAKLRDVASKEGIEGTEVDDLIERLKREGILFEPNPGYVQRP